MSLSTNPAVSLGETIFMQELGETIFMQEHSALECYFFLFGNGPNLDRNRLPNFRVA